MATIEQKAKAYDEALEKARQLCAYPTSKPFISDLQDLFPELKESEDERIRKALIKLVKKAGEGYENVIDGVSIENAISWLEKQGEHANFRNKIQIGDKVTRNEDGVLVNLSQLNRVAKKDKKQGEQKYSPLCNTVKDKIREYIANHFITDTVVRTDVRSIVKAMEEGVRLGKEEQKPTDKIEPKFKVGDWVMLDKPVLITKVEDMPYNTHQYWTSDGTWFGDATKAKLWTIQDAKDGDILTTDLVHFILKSRDDMSCYTHCNYSVTSNDFDTSDTAIVDNTYVHPTTKEQRDTLFAKMKEAGYEWDAEKKELKKIEQNPVPKFKVGDVMRTLQEAADGFTDGMPVVVSIDDEDYHCTNERIDIKDQDNYEYPPINRRQKPWSEEDEYCIHQLILFCENCMVQDSDAKKCANWLKSLKDRYTWKPSNEQMVALNNAILLNEDHYNGAVLNTLYEQLKKLKG